MLRAHPTSSAYVSSALPWGQERHRPCSCGGLSPQNVPPPSSALQPSDISSTTCNHVCLTPHSTCAIVGAASARGYPRAWDVESDRPRESIGTHHVVPWSGKQRPSSTRCLIPSRGQARSRPPEMWRTSEYLTAQLGWLILSGIPKRCGGFSAGERATYCREGRVSDSPCFLCSALAFQMTGVDQ